MMAVSLDVVRALEREGTLDTDQLLQLTGATRDELLDALTELRHADRITIDSDAELTRVVIRLAPPQVDLFQVA
jgi:hypothetical protein